MPDIEDERPPSANGLKRRQTEEPTQETKRQRTSPGKSSPVAPPPEEEDSIAQKNVTPSMNIGPATLSAPEPREALRKSVITDEKQRSKRLFGALLGNLAQPHDRTSKRRQEIESRRKAELKRQDDERLEDKQKRLKQLAEQRKLAQRKVDEEHVSAH